MSLSKDEQKILEHSGYRFVGQYGHAACKICHWTRESIVNRGVCYKEKFYGIESHRCLQMSPAVPFCQQKCSFCWRDLSLTKTEWTGQYDDVETIIDKAIEAHNLLLCGYYGNDNADKKKLEELKHPNNAAISLAGEPTLYPDIDELIGEFNHRNFSTFLVSNGQYYQKLSSLENEPRQTYLSLDAPNSIVYNDLCNPQINEGWNNLNKSLDILNSFSNNTAIRITLVKGKNMISPEEYGKLIEIADPDYVEVKAYMCVGSSRERLTLDNMPTIDEVENFAKEIGLNCGRSVSDKSEISRVVLLTQDK